MSKLLQTLARVNHAAIEKTAQEAAPVVDGYADLLRKTAAALRDTAPEPVRDEDLYAVLEKGAELEALVPPPDGDDAPAQLRKLAHAVRVVEREQTERRLEKAAYLLIAARGLTLLDEQTRPST